ncbi:MAG: hypothetical protein BWK76_05515 [Desulfobulbaceae bacterium A2]|nr:MAG: hypothetical protein BWK76_05515 [Desulfobulbaceae bacterium A2]
MSTSRASAPEKAVILLFYGRSGSNFLESLLDGHPNILVIGCDVLATVTRAFWRNHGHETDAAVLAGRFALHYPAILRRLQQLGNDVPWRFMTLLQEGLQAAGAGPYTRRCFVQQYALAYNRCLGRPVPPGAILLCHAHDPSQVAMVRHLAEDFPDCLLLHVVREPLQTLGSHFAHYFHQQPELMAEKSAEILEWVVSGILLKGCPVLPEYAQRSRAVRLEDVKRRPRATLQALCQWLGIPWHDTLLNSTCDGLPHPGMLTPTGQVQGFATTALEKKHRDILTAFDRLRLGILLHPKRRAWGYPAPGWQGWRLARWLLWPLLLFPLQMERLIRPLASRQYQDVTASGRRFGASSVFANWFHMRLVLWHGWQRLFFSPHQETSLLTEQEGCGFDQADETVIAGLCRQETSPAAWEALRRRFPGSAPPMIALLEHHLRQGRIEALEPLCTEILALVPDEPWALLGKAMVHWAETRDQEAVTAVQCLLINRPDFTAAWQLLAEMATHSNDAPLLRRCRDMLALLSPAEAAQGEQGIMDSP